MRFKSAYQMLGEFVKTSGIWCLKMSQAPLERVGYKWSRPWLYVNILRKWFGSLLITHLYLILGKYILKFIEMQLFVRRFRVCIIPAVCHDPKGTFLQFWYAIPFKVMSAKTCVSGIWPQAISWRISLDEKGRGVGNVSSYYSFDL